jgi:hypothetical protein
MRHIPGEGSRVPGKPMSENRFSTGQTVPHSGIYQVTHAGHRLPHEVTLIAGEVFPRCSKCQDAVQFESIRRATLAQADRSFRIVVYELPVMEEEDNSSKPMAS